MLISPKAGTEKRTKAERHRQKSNCFLASDGTAHEFRTIALDAILPVAFLKRSHQTSPTLFFPGVEY
jgi:hypothetical protein